MNKKILGIILIILIIAIVGVVYLGFEKGLFTGKGIGISGIGEKSIMDTAKEQGQIVPSKTDAIKECGKETDQGEKDTCYGLVAFYYRDAGLCKWIEDAETKKNCNRENIEKWYSGIEKGGVASPFTPGGLTPSGGMFPGGGLPLVPSGEANEQGLTEDEEESVPPDVINENQEKPILSGKMTDEIYIEILAQSSNPQMKTPEAFASDMKDLFKEYGITEEDITAYGKELGKDPQRAGEIATKYMKRAMELRATGK